MQSLFVSFNRNSKFVRQILRKSFNPFCLSDQDIQNHIKVLFELKEKQQVIENQLDYEKLSQQISQYEKDLDSFLTKFNIHQREPYQFFRKHLIELAYHSFQNKQPNQCYKYIEYAMCGDYQNLYKDQLMNQVFLAELYEIKYLTNYNKKADEFALKSLTNWRNVVENHCPFYKQWKENNPIDINELIQTQQLSLFQQYVQSLSLAVKSFQANEIFEQSKIYFIEAKTRIQEAIEIISYLGTQINQFVCEKKESYEEMIQYFKILCEYLLVDSYITQIKILICERNFKLGEQLLQEIEQKQIANPQQIIQFQILKIHLIFYLRYNHSQLMQLNQLIDDSMNKLQLEEDPELFSEYFALKYVFFSTINHQQ